MNKLRLNLLGTFEASAGEYPLTSFRSDKVRALLIYLLVESDRPHRREVLAGLLWPDFTQEAASRNFRKTLFLLRATIDDAEPGLSDLLFNVTRQIVQVNPEYSVVDINLFQENNEKIRHHHHKHLQMCDECLDRLTESADLYKGEFVAGFSLADADPFENWLLLKRETLNQEILVVYENLTSSSELRGEFQKARDYANRQLSLEPWREKAHRQLMRVMVLEGRRSEAIAQYENCKKILWDELGVKPSAETQLLYQKIKTGVLFPQETTTRTQLYDFPTQFSPFIGRQSLLENIMDLLDRADCRLVTLVGPGGIGKSRLSIEAANKLADVGKFNGGIYFIPMATIDTVDHFLLTLAGQLKISIFGRDHIRQHLLNYLADRNLLLVLDNFEHLVDESGLLTEILEAAPRIKILVSSREALNIRSEQRLLVGGLSEDSAVNLFHQSASKIWPAYNSADQDSKAILEICRLVGRMPLAVEIAAAWVKVMDIDTIVSQISTSFDFLQTQWQDFPERHRSMKVVFDESWKLLDAKEQFALAQFSVFQGSFSLDAAIAITEVSMNEIATLLDKSLLHHTGKSRYQLHELLRQFAGAKLLEITHEEDRKDLQSRFAQHFLSFVTINEDSLVGASPQFGMVEIEVEFENIFQAWRWATDQDQLNLVANCMGGLMMFFKLSGRFSEGIGFFNNAANTLTGKDQTPQRKNLVNALLMFTARLNLSIGQFEEAKKNLQMVVDVHTLEAQAMFNSLTGTLLTKQGEYQRGISLYHQAIQYFQSIEDNKKLVETLDLIGEAYWRAEQWPEAQKHLTNALHISQKTNFNWAVVSILMSLAMTYRKLGQYDTALDHYSRATEISLKINYLPGVARGYADSGLIHEDLGNNEKAAEYYQRSLQYDQEEGTSLRWAITNGSIARVMWKLGRQEEALAIIDESIPVLRKLNFKIHLGWQLVVKAEILFSLGRYRNAWEVNNEGLLIAKEMGMTERIRQSQILSVRLQEKFGQRGAAIWQLNEYLETFADEENMLAAVHFELWRLTDEKAHGRQSLKYYQLAYQKEPFIEYKNRIDQLSEKFLD